MFNTTKWICYGCNITISGDRWISNPKCPNCGSAMQIKF